MPTLRFHAVPQEKVLGFADQLVKDLAIAFETGEDNISLEVIDSVFIRNGSKDSAPYPMIEILAFKRDQVIESQAAQIITDTLRDAGYEYSEVFYIHTGRDEYYCDGELCD